VPFLTRESVIYVASNTLNQWKKTPQCISYSISLHFPKHSDPEYAVLRNVLPSSLCTLGSMIPTQNIPIEEEPDFLLVCRHFLHLKTTICTKIFPLKDWVGRGFHFIKNMQHNFHIFLILGSDSFTPEFFLLTKR